MVGEERWRIHPWDVRCKVMWGPVLRGVGVANHFCTDGEVEEDGDGDGLQRDGEEV